MRAPGYLLLIRVSPDGKAWMAVAAPKDPGKSGRYYFAIDKEATLYRSAKAIPLSDSCQVPPGTSELP